MTFGSSDCQVVVAFPLIPETTQIILITATESIVDQMRLLQKYSSTTVSIPSTLASITEKWSDIDRVPKEKC